MTSSNCCISLISAFIAGIVVIRYLCKLIKGLREYVFARPFGLSIDLKKIGPWAGFYLNNIFVEHNVYIWIRVIINLNIYIYIYIYISKYII